MQFAAGVIDELYSCFAMETRGVPRLFNTPCDYGNPRFMCYDVHNGCSEVQFGDMPVGGVVSMTAYERCVCAFPESPVDNWDWSCCMW